MQEVIAPKGYTLNKTKYPVTISNNNQTITVTGTDKHQSGTVKPVSYTHLDVYKRQVLYMKIKEKLAYCRRKRKLSYRELGELTNINYVTLYYI